MAQGFAVVLYQLQIPNTIENYSQLFCQKLYWNHRQWQGPALVGHWRFQGQAQAEPGQYPVLANILNLFGNRGGDIAWNVLRAPAS